MKLSDIKGERTLEVIAEIIDPIANIAEDEAASLLFKKQQLPKGKTVKQFALERIRKSVPSLLKEHKKDIIAILSAIEGTTAEEYEKTLNMVKLISDFSELLLDETFRTLFISAQNGDGSGSAPENTKAT